MYYIDIYKNTLLSANPQGLNPLAEVRNIYVFQDIYKYQQFFLKSALLLIFFGFIIYFRNKMAQSGLKWNILTFFQHNKNCKGGQRVGLKNSVYNFIK